MNAEDFEIETAVAKLRVARAMPDFGKVTPHAPTEDARAEVQRLANQTFRRSRTPATCAANLIRMVAELEHAQWPQYANHWDDWRVGVMQESVTTKMGHAAGRGDVVLYTFKHGRDEPTFYSIQNAVDTACHSWSILPV